MGSVLHRDLHVCDVGHMSALEETIIPYPGNVVG